MRWLWVPLGHERTGNTHCRHGNGIPPAMPVARPASVWSTDITCIRLAHGFAYLAGLGVHFKHAE
jgi:hypothetical protein